MDHRQIELPEGPVANLFGQSGSGPGRFSQCQETAYRPVEPVYQTQKDVTGFVIFLFEPFFAKSEQVRIARPVSLGEKIYRFFHNEKMIVLIEDRNLL